MASKLLCHFIEPKDAVNIDNLLQCCYRTTSVMCPCVRENKKIYRIAIMYKF